MSRNKGFTLLELLVALALMTVLSAALYGAYFTLVAGRDRAQAVAEEDRELRTTLDALRRELAAAYYKTPADPEKPRYRFIVEDRDFFGKPASTLVFSTIAPPASGAFPVSDQVEVEYRPVAREQAMTLTRRTRDVFLDTIPAAYPQMEELQGFLVECYNGSKWERTWDAKLHGGMLPQQVRITIMVKDGDKTVPFVAIATPRVVR